MKKQNIAILGCAVCTVMVMLTWAIAVIPALAQNAVPPTAREAAASPAFAPRLTRPAMPQPARKSPASARIRTHPASTQDGGVIYENGPVNGNTDAWTINSGFAVSDTVVVAGSSTVTGVDFYAWLFPGDTISSVEVDFGSLPFGTSLLHETVSLSESNCQSNDFGFNVCLESGNITNGPVLGGTVWMTLQNASVTSGDPVYWDENSGIGCHSMGCPSQAYESGVGTIPSEAFDITGNNCYGEFKKMPAPQPAQTAQAQSFKVIYNFTGGQDGAGPGGLTIDKAGNFYGTTAGGGYTAGSCGSGGCGAVYKLWRQASGWVLNALYNFKGADYGDGDQPSSRVIVGPDGTLYGVTSHGGTGTNCGGACGTVFNLKPAATACRTALCGWTETVLYSFKGYASGDRGSAGSCSLQESQNRTTRQSLRLPADGGDGAYPSGDLVFDQAGNIYGTTALGPGPPNGYCGGCENGACGLIYQLAPSNGGWEESIVLAFDDYGGGSVPQSGIIFDKAGNSFGTTTFSYGNGEFGTVFGDGGSLFSFPSDGSEGVFPVGGLMLDASGNLFGTTSGGRDPGDGCYYGGGTVFELPYPYYQEYFTELVGFGGSEGPTDRLIMDVGGSLYGATVYDGAYDKGSVFKLTPGKSGWTYTNLYDFTGGADGGGPSGLTWDANGNLWGTASGGGAYGYGVIFEITP